MPMTSRERMLTALDNKRPDRLPCQVHGWMKYYLKHYLDGADWWQANEQFGMDYAIYVSPRYEFDEKDMANWVTETKDLGLDKNGNRCSETTITTPKGKLHSRSAASTYSGWKLEPLIKTQEDFELWAEYRPVPVRADLTQLEETRDRLGDKGIIRSHPFSAGQGSPWQSLCILMETQPAILMAMDEPEWVHHALECILEKTLRATELWEGTPADMVETDGGAGSSTVISPKMFKEFCVPYDQKQNELFHALGIKVVCHLCGGLMHMLDLVVESGADGLETMTPPAMGGDCDLAEASRRVGDKLFFIGGFDQNAGFESGTPEAARQLVIDCFEATKDHAGYIIAPSDHFFHGDTENLQAFADAAKECVY